MSVFGIVQNKNTFRHSLNVAIDEKTYPRYNATCVQVVATVLMAAFFCGGSHV